MAVSPYSVPVRETLPLTGSGRVEQLVAVEGEGGGRREEGGRKGGRRKEGGGRWEEGEGWRE